MLSPKMPRSVRVNDSQLLMLSDKAHYDHSMSGYLYKRTADSTKWQVRYFVLYQNILFYYDNQNCVRPSGVILLEGCYCEQLITTKGKEAENPQLCFAISYRRENQRQYELKSSSEADCKAWIEAIREASFNKMMLQKEELEQKHLHLLQIVESEKTAKWQYTQQCEELTSEIKKLHAELCALKKELRRPVASGAKSNTASASRARFQRTMSHVTGSLAENYRAGISSGQSGLASSSTYNAPSGSSSCLIDFKEIPENSAEMNKIKKVQSFFRGWLCRRRWKQIVEQYIKSPHAESMRKRNSLVFKMVEAEEEYTEQMEVLVSCFLRPFRMAASSKNPPCSHEDVNSIFLNSETVLFLHQIFLKGLTSRMESWPTLVLGDLFDMLLPMLSIYQEYVRNHHYSFQVLTECKQTASFAALLKRLEEKSVCHGRSLETFLTYPMHQIPRYIITLHELLAHTPHDHVERKSLQNARQQLEDLSRQMHDEVSETENLRKNLAVERMIVEGCDILLDVNQVFVRQGTLIQILEKPSRGARSRFAPAFGGGGSGKSSDKEIIRQCYLFSNHLILTTRQSDDHGRLNLVPDIGKIPLSDAVLVEDPGEPASTTNDDDDLSECSMSSGVSEAGSIGGVGSGGMSATSQLRNRDFKLIVDLKIAGESRKTTIHLVAPTMQEKAAWISDVSQCIDNVHFNDLLHGSLSDASSVTMPQSIRNDPKLFKDDVDIRFSRTLNSCKVPQIRYATPDRLLQRLTDLRFLSIDFLNTFLLTYRVFTDGETVLEALKKVFYDAEPPDAPVAESPASVDHTRTSNVDTTDFQETRRRSSTYRRTSGASSVSGYGSEVSDSKEVNAASSCETPSNSNTIKNQWRSSLKKGYDGENLAQISESSTGTTDSCVTVCTPEEVQETEASKSQDKRVAIRLTEKCNSEDSQYYLTIPKVINASSSSETLTDTTVVSAPSSPSNLSSVTLVGSGGSGSNSESDKSPMDASDKNCISREISEETEETPLIPEDAAKEEDCRSPVVKQSPNSEHSLSKSIDMPSTSRAGRSKRVDSDNDESSWTDEDITPPAEPYYPLPTQCDPNNRSQRNSTSTDHRASITSNLPTSSRSSSISTSAGNYWLTRRSIHDSETNSSSQQSAYQYDTTQTSRKAGVVITSSRQSHRRSSTSIAATAFAIATSASSNPRDRESEPNHRGSCREKNRRKESVMSTAATMRVLSVLRHWVSKHAQDFEMDEKLKYLTRNFLEDIMNSPNLLPAEHKAASQVLKLITKEESDSQKVDLKKLLKQPTVPTTESIESLSALEIAEQMTYIDHQIFISIASEEFLGQAWMKADRATRAPHITLMTKRFNEVSQLVVSEIIRRSPMQSRVAAIEKWAAVADISRVLHNYNGVLQICAAFTNSSVFRLKKTWEKVSKQTKQTIERLQTVVSSEHRFRNLRDALRRCDPPCIPYLGLYLTDLSFIEEGTPNFTEDGLLNFSKMRMIAHVIREIRHFQQVPYKIELIAKVRNYLLDPSLLIDEENLYRLSLEIEPRASRLSSAALIGIPPNLSALRNIKDNS